MQPVTEICSRKRGGGSFGETASHIVVGSVDREQKSGVGTRQEKIKKTQQVGGKYFWITV